MAWTQLFTVLGSDTAFLTELVFTTRSEPQSSEGGYRDGDFRLESSLPDPNYFSQLDPKFICLSSLEGLFRLHVTLRAASKNQLEVKLVGYYFFRLHVILRLVAK